MRWAPVGAGNSSSSVKAAGARPVHGGTYGHLQRFQIETPGLAPTLENDPQELIYFARDLLTDRFGRFFSCSVSDSSSIGRRWQILALVTINSRLSCWKLRNSATSRSALRAAAGVDNDSERVLPSTL